MQGNIYKKLAQLEAAANVQRAEQLDFLRKAYEAACESKDAEEAAACARALRDKLLCISDKEMTLDRLQLDTGSATKFILSIGNILKGDWATYRKSLRDLPEQEGFPFDISFPVSPDEADSENLG